jgi:hypothetical protein
MSGRDFSFVGANPQDVNAQEGYSIVILTPLS